MPFYRRRARPMPLSARPLWSRWCRLRQWRKPGPDQGSPLQAL